MVLESVSFAAKATGYAPSLTASRQSIVRSRFMSAQTARGTPLSNMARDIRLHAISIVRRASARSTRISLRNSIISWLRPPWIVTAARHRAMPSGVFRPVDAPPCILHRPFFIGRFLHGVPARVFAPQGAGPAAVETDSHESFDTPLSSGVSGCMG